MNFDVDVEDYIDARLIDNICDYCKNNIDEISLKTIDGKYKFCDIVCCRLYECTHNVTLFPNLTQYKTHFKNGLLNNHAASLYKLTNIIPYDLLPIVTKNMDKETYINILTSYIQTF